jgi:hypothetical protein
MRGALPEGPAADTPAEQLDRLERLTLRYTRRHTVPPEEPYTARYDVFADRLHTGAHPARIAYGAWVKARAGLRHEATDDLARADLRRDADGWIGESIAESAFVVLAELALGGATDETERTVATIASRIDGHGRFATHRDPTDRREEFQDYAPGQALLALAAAARQGIGLPTEPLRRALRYYRMRFRQNTAWGAVAWLPQAYAAWGRLLGDDELTGFAFEVADRALTFQSRKIGGFLNDHQRDAPGATTALYLEALTAVVAAAGPERAARYSTACARGLEFLDSLVYQARDTAVLPNPEWALGGIRTSATASDVRIDYVHHALSAVLGLRSVSGEAFGAEDGR